MLSNYKKLIKITEVHGITGVLTYNLFYDTMITNLSEEVTRIQDSLNIVNRLPEPGDKIFFLNGVTIPRFKIKKFYEDTGAKGVKYIESSNVLVIGKNTTEEYFNRCNLYTTEGENIIKYMDDWILNNIGQDNTWVHDLRVLINDIGEDVCVAYYYNRDRLKAKGVELQKYSNEYLELSLESYDKLEKILNLKCDIIDETVILKQLNSTITMTEEIYDSIQNLMNSSDRENMKIAMELMSNCDYDSSAVYLLLLLKKYHNKIYTTHTKNHINFKALLNYFDFTVNSNFNINMDTLIEKCKDKKIPFQNYRAILTPFILEDYNSESTNYRMSDITFIDEDGEDIIVEDTVIEVEEIAMKIVTEQIETILKEELRNIYESPIDLPGVIPEVIELDPIVFDELTEVIGYCNRLGFVIQGDKLLEVRDQIRHPEDLLEVIKFLDTCGSFEEATLLIQSYLDIP